MPAAPARAAAFGALAVFGALQWAQFLSPAAGGRALGCAAVATMLAAGLAVAGASPRPRLVAFALALLATAAALLAALTIAGLEPRLLGWRNWDELGAGVDTGFGVIADAQWPYAGSEQWVRDTLLAGLALLLVGAAALCFWPARGPGRRAALEGAGLVTLLMPFAIAVTEQDPTVPFARGVVLLMLLGAYLWLPRARRGQLAAAVAMLAIAAIVALPLATRLDPASAAIDYGSWKLFEDSGVKFDWNHSYGPLDWPREGRRLLEIRSPRSHYWKAETLDRFDGRRWLRSRENQATRLLAELPDDPQARWDSRFTVTVRSLSSDFVIGAGTPYSITGAGDSLVGSADGTVRRLDEPLEEGDTYGVRAYVPAPRPAELRGEPARWPAALAQYTRIAVPAAGEGTTELAVPFMGDAAGRGEVARALIGSPYAGTYRLTSALTAGASTPWEAVEAIQSHLRGDRFSYSEDPPAASFPLEAFVTRDRIGYCQQFSGAMALMLRMAGVPARAVSGFSPGERDREEGTFEVRDLDAHSWVEAWFPSHGWVTFDPTPARAADTEPSAASPAAGRDAAAAGAVSRTGTDRAGAAGRQAPAAAPGDTGSPDLAAIAIMLAVLGLTAAAGAVAVHGRRPRAPGELAARRLRELERGLPRVGVELAPGTTLLALEARLAAGRGMAAAGYAAALRAARYGDGGSAFPGAADRRALRRDLVRGRGPRVRIAALLAFPPSPFRRR